MPDFTEPLYSIRVLLAEARDRSTDPIAVKMIDAAVALLAHTAPASRVTPNQQSVPPTGAPAPEEP